MSVVTVRELRRIEKQYPRGISSVTIVEVFKKKGERFSAPTLRKYVQLGLLPKSKRVGTRGRHKGSSGLYPVVVIRLINQIKRALEKGSTLEEIRLGTVGLAGEVQALQRAAEEVLRRFNEALKYQPKKQSKSGLKRALDMRKRSLYREIRALERYSTRLGQPRLQDE